MENVTSTRRGRPRKDMDLSGNASQSTFEHNADTTDGQVGAVGSGTQAVSDRSFKSLVESVKAYKVMYDSVAMAFHPNPEETMIETAKGWVRVGIGEAGFQTNRGIFVKL